MSASENKRIGIVAAMDVEVEAIKERCEIESHCQIAQRDFWYGTLSGKPIVICKSGVGKVGAAMTTTILCMNHSLSAIVNIGTAGGLLQKQNVLDIVISQDVIQADFDTSPIDGPEGLGLRFHADTHLMEKAIEAACMNHVPYHVGTIASQDLFMARDEDFAKLMRDFPDSVCSEMEAGAIAQVATECQIPFVILRSLSDVAVHHDNPMEFSTYVQHASRQSSQLVKTLIEIV